MFPKSTAFNVFIAKEKFYKHGEFSTSLKAEMTENIAKMTITNKLSSDTLNIKSGSIFPEIIVLKIILKKRSYNTQLLDLLDKSIRSSYVLFILEFEQQSSFSISFKEKNRDDNITITKRWNTQWQDEINLDINGGSIDIIYENLIKQISKNEIKEDNETTLKEKVAKSIEEEKIKKIIKQLENKMNNELQLKRKLEIKAKIKELKAKIGE